MSVPDLLEALTDTDRGTFRVFTEASAYLVTLVDDRHTLLRSPGDGLGEFPGLGPLAPTANLRVDDGLLDLLHIEKCAVGERAIFLVAMPDGVPVAPGYTGVTIRETTIVRGITRVPGLPAVGVTFDREVWKIALPSTSITIANTVLETCVEEFIHTVRECVDGLRDGLNVGANYAFLGEFVEAVDASSDADLREWVQSHVRKAAL